MIILQGKTFESHHYCVFIITMEMICTSPRAVVGKSYNPKTTPNSFLLTVSFEKYLQELPA